MRTCIRAVACLLASAAGLGASSAVAGATTLTVWAGPPAPTAQKQLDLDGFFPSFNRIHVGDSLSFEFHGFHTVTFLSGKPAPAFVIPAPSSPITGKLDAGGAPFWFNGQPNLVVNPEAQLPSGGNTYEGTGYVNSGLPNPSGPPQPFVVQFTKAGTYSFYCLVHPGMKGTVTVLPAKKTIPSAAKQKARALAQEKAWVKRSLGLAKVSPGAHTILAGHDGPGWPTAWLRFFPETLKVKVGSTVHLKVASGHEIHTFTFGPAAYTKAIAETFTTPVEKAGAPPSLVLNPLGAYPSDPLPLPPFTGANHGNGFANTGILALGGHNPSSADITFTKPGTYTFDCVVHEGMDGKVIVTP